MDATAILVTVAAGLAMGAINNVAGGAGVLGLIAFEQVLELPTRLANPTTRPAAIGVGLFAWLGYLRAGLKPLPLAWKLGVFAVPGAFVGNLMAEELPVVLFHGYLAVVLIALLLQQWLRRHVRHEGPLAPAWIGAVGCFLVGAHMGFVQVGTGFVATLVLQSTYSRDLVATNAAKAAIVILASVASVAGFAIAPWFDPQREAVIVWEPALWLAAGTAIGSYGASKWSVAKGHGGVRRVVVVVATASLGYELWRVAVELQRL